MQFPFYPKHQYGCPVVGNCPHIGGASLGMLVHAASQQTDWTSGLQRQIDSLRKENSANYVKIKEQAARIEQLESELKAERQKQFKRKKEQAAEEDTAERSRPPGPKKLAPVGHPGWYRKRPTDFDQLILVAPRPIARTAALPSRPGLIGPSTIISRRIGSRASVRQSAIVTKPAAAANADAGSNAGDGRTARAMIGPHMRAASMFLQYAIGMTTRKIVQAVEGWRSFPWCPPQC